MNLDFFHRVGKGDQAERGTITVIPMVIPPRGIRFERVLQPETR